MTAYVRAVRLCPRLRAPLLAGCLLARAAIVIAQPTGHLAGVVRDTSGGLLPGAMVTLTGAALVGPRVDVTNDRGSYEFGNLPTGQYVVEASLNGFDAHSGIVDVEGTVAATLDLVLGLGSLAETVTVTATKTGVADVQSTPIAVTLSSLRCSRPYATTHATDR